MLLITTLVMYYCIMLCDSTNTDECEGDNECTQLCINTNGGYNGAYRDGFYILSDNKTCQNS